MDPITILGAVGTTLKIVKEICEGLQWMQRVYENMTNGNKILQSIALECNIYGESIKAIGQWLKNNKNATGLKRQMRTTQNAITLVQCSMANLLLDLKKCQETGDKSSVKKLSKDKLNIKMFQQFILNAAKQQWFQETMKIHLVELRAHAATLHLTLGVIELTGSTPEDKGKTPNKLENETEELEDKKLEDKTKKLERRLLLRKFITKALEIKRAEILESARPNESEKSSSESAVTSSPDLIQGSPPKLTFYDVVQLVLQLRRQQSLVEKTRKSSVDLIDLSDAAQPVLDQAPSTNIQSDDDLFDSSSPMALQLIDPFLLSQNEPRSSELYQNVEFMSKQLASPELNTTLSQEPSGLDLLGLIDAQASHVDLISKQPTSPELETALSQEPSGLDLLGLIDAQTSHVEPMSKQPTSPELETALSQEPSGLNLIELVDAQASYDDELHKEDASEQLVAVATPNQQDLPLHQSSAALAHQESDTKEEPAALDPNLPEAPQAGDSKTQEINELIITSPDNLSDAAIQSQENNTDDALTDISPTSTAAPSIFSHFSSLTGATSSSLSGITEEDVQARNSSSNTTLKVASVTPTSSPPTVQRKTLGSVRPSMSKSPGQGNDAELCRSLSTSSTPSMNVDPDLPSKPQRPELEDSVSQSPALPPLSNIDEPDKEGFPWIVQAARDGNEEIIQKLIVSGADIKASHATTLRHALSEASIHDHQKVVDLLVKEGCPLEYCDTEGYTALHHACQRGHLSVAKILITNGALVDASGPQGQTALHLAMHVPHQNVVMLLIQHKASVNARDATFRTPLHIGASQGNVAMCNYLLNEGAQLDSREAQSKTPLQLACEAGHYDLVQMMLNQSDLNPTNMTFLAAFFAAVECGHIRIAESFFPRGLNLQELRKDSHKPATLAAKSGSLAMVELMIKENCDANASDENGWNALHFASYYGHYQVIERLIANDVSTNATTSKKETPLLFAVKGGHFVVAERLLRCSKDGDIVSAEDEQHQQAVHHTTRTGSIEIFNLLMSNGAKINVENSFGWHPLHIATAYGHLPLVKRILEQGANIEEKLGSSSIKNNQTHKIVEDGYWAEARWPYPGSRPLHLACEYGHYEIAKYLISKGAKREATCSQGWQPLHHAAYIGSSPLVEMLLVSGVYPHATTNEGKTAQELEFCTGGAPILEEEKERIRNLLKEAMARVRKQKTKSFKGVLKRTDTALKRSDTVEEKNNLVRAATFSMNSTSRPHTHRVMTTMQISDPPLDHSPLASFPHRPTLPHHSHTSPLPLRKSDSLSRSQAPSTPLLPESQPETQSPAPPLVADSNLQNTDKVASPGPTADSVTDELPPLSKTNTPDAGPAPETEMQLSVQPEPKIKRKSTLGLSKVRPGMDMGKLGLGSIGKQTFAMGKQTFEIGKQGLELGKQGIELGKQGLEKGKQGLELGKQGLELGKQGMELGKQGLDLGKQGLEIVQGLEMGRQGIDIGKQGYKAAKQFAKKGKMGSGKLGSGKRTQKSKSSDGQTSKAGNKDLDRSVDNVVVNAIDDKLSVSNNDDDDSDDDGESILDDAASAFSLGDFADLGNDDF
ncbi:hypothetical protein JMJ35_001477 [Cladonia borealis]|uniref:Ankyrin repeat protein n=1 Tax=Cladonia borealis TaxID=184061 RepID=A0AA39V464_9LECA|nr:hypothetical protein JMJ35_001477 [Cladonia borealis]